MAKPRKPTPNQAAWAKEVKRLEREMKKAQRLGKSVPAGFIPETPTRITQKQLNLIRSKTLKPKKQKPEAETRKPPRSKGEEKRRKPRTAGVSQTEHPISNGAMTEARWRWLNAHNGIHI